MEHSEIISFIKSEMNLQGVTLKVLSLEIGCHKGTLSKILNGKRPGYEIANKALEALGYELKIKELENE